MKEEFTRITGKAISREENDLQFMMKNLELEFSGRLHAGKDDVVNICKVLQALSERDKFLHTAADDSSFVNGNFPKVEDIVTTSSSTSKVAKVVLVCMHALS